MPTPRGTARWSYVALPTLYSTAAKSYARSEDRELVYGKGDLTWDHGAQAKQSTVEVRNISDNGVQLRVSEYVRTGAAAYLTGTEYQCVGTVRYCVPNGQGFLAGLEFSREPHFKNTLS